MSFIYTIATFAFPSIPSFAFIRVSYSYIWKKSSIFAKGKNESTNSQNKSIPIVNKKTETVQFIKYASVGVSNTVITFLTFTLLRALGVGEDVSNALGYIAGMLNSFCWNRQWVFKSKDGNGFTQAVWFLVGAGVCWLIQWIIFRLLLSQDINESIAYLLGMVVYTILNYLFNKLITFRKPKTKE